MTENTGNLKSQLEALCVSIQNPERMIRQTALKTLLELSKSNFITPENSLEVFDYLYLHVLKCYSDKFEMCRSLACSIVSEILIKLPENDYYLDYIIPAITRRIGQKELIEESEEMRLQLIQQLLEVIDKYKVTPDKKTDSLLKSYNDIIDILIKTLRDPYPAIQKECCGVIKSLSTATPSFHYRAEVLVNPLVEMLKHRQSPNRIAAIEALGIVNLNITSNGECILKNIVEMSTLLMDSMPYVRRECGRMGCRLLLELRDRYSFFDRILPLVLCCLTDGTEEVRNEINDLWQKCGTQYFEENENELSKIELVDQKPENYPENIVRPTLGCRAIVQRSLKMINLILYEMEDWKEEIRLHATKLLGQTVLHCEKALTAKFIEIHPVLAVTCMDKEPKVAAEAMKVANLIGILLDYKSWIYIAIDNWQKFPNLGYLKCFTAMFSGANSDKLNDIELISALMANPDICHSLEENYQAQLLNLAEILVDIFMNLPVTDGKGDGTIQLSEKYLHKILVTTIAFAEGNKEVTERGKILLLKLAETSLGVKELHSKYLSELVDSIENLESLNSAHAEPILLLHGIIINCGFEKNYLEVVRTAILKVLDNANPDAKIKIMSAVSVAMLNWNSSINTELGESTDLLRTFVQDIFVPCLIWKAGRSSESLRAMTTGSLCSMSQGAPEEAALILPALTVHLQALVEDTNVSTRAFAIRTILKCGPVDIQDMKPLAYAILSRLDDPSSEVRKWAGHCLSKLQITPSDNKPEYDSWQVVIKQIFSVILLHMDDPDIKLREVLIDTIKIMGKEHKKIFEEVFGEISSTFPYQDEIAEIRAAINA